MEKKTRYFIRFWSPGTFFGEDHLVEVDSKPVPDKVEFPGNAYCFSMNYREDVIDEDGTVYKGEMKRIDDKTYYHPDSVVRNREQVIIHESEDGRDCSTLLSNMRINKWDSLIYSRWGNWPQPFDPKTDVVLP